MTRESEPIAIIGSACRFAGDSSSPSKLWELLRDPLDVRQQIPDSRFHADGFYHPQNTKQGHTNVKHSYIINEDPAVFDSEFFGIKPVEAKAIDPQQRWLMEIIYEGLEAAGLPIQSLKGSNTSVYAGLMCADYQSMQMRDLEFAPTYAATGTSRSILSNRISYFFDWHGPSMTIDTACSSSLVALHLAVQSLRSGDSNVAIACGANLLLSPDNYVAESRLNMLSPDGVSRMWDADANGYARGEGIAAVVLKTLSAALRDGDHIESVVRETGTNQDGATPGITMPSASAQEALIRDTYTRAGLNPWSNPQDRPQYFEAHGTGTPAGDPLEAEAIYRAFRYNDDVNREMLSTADETPLYVGSIKTVLGHTEGTAGLAGVLKASLALRHGVIPPNLLFNRLSDSVAPFYKDMELVTGEARPWPSPSPGDKSPVRRASVNSFGFGGSNAHVILESYQSPDVQSELASIGTATNGAHANGTHINNRYTNGTDTHTSVNSLNSNGTTTNGIHTSKIHVDGAGNNQTTLNGDIAPESPPSNPALFVPYVFSAGSEQSLRTYLSIFSTFLVSNPHINHQNLSWTLRSRRSTLPYRTYFPASSIKDLKRNMGEVLAGSKSVGNRADQASIPSTDAPKVEKILGIFTGQGAQYPRMAAELIEQSPEARRKMDQLEGYLAALPTEDRPSWSLTAEILAANRCAPLCNSCSSIFWHFANVHFDVVVGHSSGEIAAAYAAGGLSARDALYIAYYRGVFAHQARSPSGPTVEGGMMAVGTDMADAQDLCNDVVFRGRLTVAACNSSSSVTVSGDVDALDELEEILQDEKKFYRRLRVDKAYHSRHMEGCADPYLQSLRRVGVQSPYHQPDKGRRPVTWISSVYDRAMDVDGCDAFEISGQYWIENMTRPVLFSQALSTALRLSGESQFEGSSFRLAIEVGPHPALRGPANQTIQEALGKQIPYGNTLDRGLDAVSALSMCLGFLWQCQSHCNGGNGTSTAVDLDAFQRAMIKVSGSLVNGHASSIEAFTLLKDLPPYQWNHNVRHWAESRSARRTRLLRGSFHPLLGHPSPDSSPHHLIWRNLLSATSSEEWMVDHSIQGQAVFPAAGYISTALEAARALPLVAAAASKMRQHEGSHEKTDSLRLELVELRDMNIHQAVTIPADSKEGVEIHVELSNIELVWSQGKIRAARARFEYSAALGRSDDSLTLAASALVEARFTQDTDVQGSESLLPIRPRVPAHMVNVDVDRFYSSLASLGYEYSGRFRSMETLKRKHGRTACLVTKARAKANDTTDDKDFLLVHPAELDSSLQSLVLAYSYPGDGQLRQLHLPRRMGLIRINPALCGDRGLGTHGDASLFVDAAILTSTRNGKVSALSEFPGSGFKGDISIYTDRSPHAAIQVHQVELVPFGSSRRHNIDGDEKFRKIFTRTSWVGMAPDGIAAATSEARRTQLTNARDTYAVLERIAAFYLKQFDLLVADDSPLRTIPVGTSESPATALYLQYAKEQTKCNALINPGFASDTFEDIQEAGRPFECHPDVRTMHFVGKTMPHVFRGEMTMLEAYRETGLLDDYFTNSFSIVPSGRWQANIAAQIAKRHPHLNMLEIGAGTGGTTKHVLRALGESFRTYTFTDVSAGFLSNAAGELASFPDRILYKTLDIESDPVSQGFQLGSYDVIIASFVLHATSSLSRTLANARKLLRPGGFLIVGENSQNAKPVNFMFGPLAGWWLQRSDNGRAALPHVSADTWDHLLRSAGFSGIGGSCRSPVDWEDTYGVCLFVSQAMDEQTQYLTAPLSVSQAPSIVSSTKLTIVGGRTPSVAQLVDRVRLLLEPFMSSVTVSPSLVDLNYDDLMADHDSERPAAVLSLVDLDKPTFKDMSEEEYTAVSRMFQDSKVLLWVTNGRRDADPFSNTVIGYGRVAVHENEDLYLQHLDLPCIHEGGAAKLVAEVLLRLVAVPTAPVAGDRKQADHLWTVEREIVVGENGNLLVPRLLPLRTANGRYSSGRCTVLRPDVDLTKIAVAFEHHEKEGLVLRSSMTRARSSPGTVSISTSAERPAVTLRLQYAIMHALKTPLGYKFLVAGVDCETKTHYMAFVPSMSSIMDVPKAHAVALSSAQAAVDSSMLYNAAIHVLALSLTWALMPGQTILVHNASYGLAVEIATHAATKGASAAFVVDEDATSPHDDTATGLVITQLSGFVSQEELRHLLPPIEEISRFVSLSVSFGRAGTHTTNVVTTIVSILPKSCRVELPESLFGTSGVDNSPRVDGVVGEILAKTLHRIQARGKPHSEVKVLRVEDVASKGADFRNLDSQADRTHHHPDDYLTVLDLAKPPPVPVRIVRVDHSGPMFLQNRTYWMVGLSGALGISLCDWMANAGARHIVISSRNPQVAESWIEEHRRNGVDIAIVKCDITKYDSLAEAHETIRASYPPIAGILNGAMVLRDTSIRNMTYTDMMETLNPKVLGSLYLDQIFSQPGVAPLDFFSLLSSINCVIGNQGQANYAAANTFLCALAASRRRRGLPGNAVNVGAIIGAGYMQRSSTRVLDLTVLRGAMMHLSEEDFHQLMAQSFVSCRPGSGGVDDVVAGEGHFQSEENGHVDEGGPEITTGLLEVPYNIAERPIWFHDPMFEHLITQSGMPQDQKIDSDSITLAGAAIANPTAVQTRLKVCQSREDVESTLIQAFAYRLRQELQLTTRDEELMTLRSSDIGIDSLVSVDIRSWFLKAVGVSIPVLRIMSNETMMSLVQHAVDKVSSEIIPGLSDIASSTSTSPGKASSAVTGNESCQEATPAYGEVSMVASGRYSQVERPIVPASSVFKAGPDWDAETRPCHAPDGELAALLSAEVTFATPPAQPPRAIVLTGSTGLLGCHVLENLIDSTPVDTRVICIAIRGGAKRLDMKQAQFSASGKAVFYEGDLALPLLGLSPQDCATIFASADVVIHAGADTSHMKSYRALRDANVGGTAELARLCLPRMIPIHFVSSVGVGLFPSDDSRLSIGDDFELRPAKAEGTPPVSMASLDAQHDPSAGIELSHSGYVASKWACERLLERTNAAHGLPVWIHRPSTIIRQGRDAEGHKARLDWMHGLVSSVRTLRAVPRLTRATGALDMVYPRNVCSSLVSSVMRGRAMKDMDNSVSYVHQVGDIVVPLTRLQDLVRSEWNTDDRLQTPHEIVAKKHVGDSPGDVGDGCDVLPMDEWVARAVAHGLNPAVAALVQGMDVSEGGGILAFPRLIKSS